MTSFPANTNVNTDAIPAERKLRVAVLMGGTSSEREISLNTGRQIVSALDPLKYDVIAIDTRDLLQLGGKRKKEKGESLQIGSGHTQESLIEQEPFTSHQPPATSHPPDLVFIALHGRGGEDGAVQGMLEVLGIPYTGSGILASALAMDKAMTKRLFRSAGIPVANEILLARQPADTNALTAQIQEQLGGFPVFVKPNREGSTVGGTLVQDGEQLTEAVNHAFKYDTTVLIEQYLRGMEITVGVLGNAGEDLTVLPVVEIVPTSSHYDFESKYAAGGSEHIIPARLDEAQTQEVQEFARNCHTLLGCRGMSRTDFIVTPDGPFALETNTIPGMTPTSLLPQAAAVAGITFPELLDRIIASAHQPGGAS